jgi:aspartate-semialdehyde dehydrogenase
MGFKVAVVGATGNVGREMLGILAERLFPADEVVALASRKSMGSEVSYGDKTLKCKTLEHYDFSDVDICLMSAGGAVSKEWSPKIAAQGAVVIDNSSTWRMDPDVPLVVSEVNPHALDSIPKGIVANPNCTTMVAMPPLAVLHREAGLNRLVVSTYQAVSGAGLVGSEELAEQVLKAGDGIVELTYDGSSIDFPAHDSFPDTIAFNVIPEAGAYGDGDLADETVEETKLRNETRKILEIPDLPVAVTCVRVPVFTGHSLSIAAGFERALDRDRALELLAEAPGVVVDERPTPLKAAGADPSFVGRVRVDPTVQHGLQLFVSGDNLRKGAALNAVQVAELLEQRG